jgi:hypothetical protein
MSTLAEATPSVEGRLAAALPAAQAMAPRAYVLRLLLILFVGLGL